MTTLSAYLAGPDVFLPNAREHAARKVAICARFGILGRPPLNEDMTSQRAMPEQEAWQTIFAMDLAMMRTSDIVIANLTPFRGPSADAGTLIEVGWFLGQGKPTFGYSNVATSFAERNRRYLARCPDPIAGLSVEGFGLPDNLMIPGAVVTGGGCPMTLPADGQDLPFDDLDCFERCVEIAATQLAGRTN